MEFPILYMTQPHGQTYLFLQALSSLPPCFLSSFLPAWSLSSSLTHHPQVSQSWGALLVLCGHDLVFTLPWVRCFVVWCSSERVRGLKTSLNSALLTTCHRGRGLFFLHKHAIPSSPSSMYLGRPPPRGSTFSNSPTQRASHFQICTKALANRAVTLSCEAGIIFHILHLKKLRLSKAKCLAQGYITGKDRNQAPLYLAL